MTAIPECFYRVSVKALILNETGDKFLIAREASGKWELLGGGLDWGTQPQAEVAREIMEEAGIPVTFVAEHPSYFYVKNIPGEPYWYANVIYETELAHLNITPSEECREIAFVNKDTVGDRDVCQVTQQLLAGFDPTRHQM